MKLKSLILIPIFSLFALTSCKGNNKDPYKDKVKTSDKLVLTNDIKRTYDSGSSISIGDLKVTFDGESIDYLDSNEDTIPPNKYFITMSTETPTLSRLKPSDKLNTGNRVYKTNVYVALIYTDGYVYISSAKEITINNSKALNPILYYVGGGVIIVAVAALVFFTKKYKETHP